MDRTYAFVARLGSLSDLRLGTDIVDGCTQTIMSHEIHLSSLEIIARRGCDPELPDQWADICGEPLRHRKLETCTYSVVLERSADKL